MKTQCVLTDGDSVLDTRDMDAYEYIQANKDCDDNTAGEWRWIIDPKQSGLREFDVVVSNHDGNCSTGFTIKATSSGWLRLVYLAEWHFVHVTPVSPIEPDWTEGHDCPAGNISDS